MSDSGESGGRDNRFHIGPAYYYMQIASARIFGSELENLAYPDLLFSILSIPLLYFFLKKYFSASLSLVLAGLYATSFYSLNSSHSAWNPHLIPFFAILFLLAVYEFVSAGSKTRWTWVALLGIALGIGIQLHAIMLVLMPLFLFLIFIYLPWKDRGAWKKCLAVALVAIVLNSPQIISELRTDFSNTKVFFKSAQRTKEKSRLVDKVAKNIDCHFQANGHIISGAGESNCQFLFANLFEQKKPEGYLREISNPLTAVKVMAAFMFSFFGYFLVVRNYREADRRKKIFISIVSLYILLAFLIMIPVVEEPLRYFIHLFFVPYIFLGLMIRQLSKKYSVNPSLLTAVSVAALAVLNIYSIYPTIKELSLGARSSQNAIVLGEMEKIADYIIAESDPEKTAYFNSAKKCANFYRPLAYVAERRGFDLIKDKENGETPSDANIFYLTRSDKSGVENNLENAEAKKLLEQVRGFQVTR